MSVIDAPVTLPRMAFLTAWQMLDLGDPHPILGTDLHYWVSDDVRRELHTHTIAALAEHGLARSDRLNPLWRNTLTIIAGAGREFYGWTLAGDASRAILVAATDEDAVRVIVEARHVILEPVSAQWLATSLCDSLPEVDGADIRAVRVPQTFYDDPYAESAGDPLAEPPDTRDLNYLKAVTSSPYEVAHQLYTACRDADGRRRRSSPVTALDLTDRGRVLTYLSGDDHIVVEPGTASDIIRVLNTTHEDL